MAGYLNAFRLLVLASLCVVYFLFFAGDHHKSGPIRRAPVEAKDFRLQFTAPSKGASVQAGAFAQLSWPADNSGKTFDLELWSATNYVYTIAYSLPSNVNSYTWHVPFVLKGGEYSIRLFVTDGRGPYAIAPSIYVGAAPAPLASAKVTSPTARSFWFLEANNTISFNVQGDFNSWGADIYCLVDGSSQFNGLTLTDLQSSNSRSYTFTLPKAWSTGRYFVRFFVYRGTSIDFFNSEEFLVSRNNGDVAEQELLEFITPKYETQYIKGNNARIEWKVKGETKFQSLSLALWNSNVQKYPDSLVETLATNLLPNTTLYNWVIPKNLVSSRQYYFQVYGLLLKSDGTVDQKRAAVTYSPLFIISDTEGNSDTNLEPRCVGSNCRTKPDRPLSNGRGGSGGGLSGGSSAGHSVTPNAYLVAFIVGVILCIVQ